MRKAASRFASKERAAGVLRSTSSDTPESELLTMTVAAGAGDGEADVPGERCTDGDATAE